MKIRSCRVFFITALALSVTVFANAAHAAAQLPNSLRLYVLDGGTLGPSDPARYNLKREEVTTTEFSVGCFLIAHPKGLLMWDTCAVPDSAWKPTGSPVHQHLLLPRSQTREVTVTKSVREQLTQAGYRPEDINYLALSHFHYDHTANANLFAKATWLVTQVEHDAMLSPQAGEITVPENYSALRNSKVVILKGSEHDVFGDGSVIIKLAPGHTPGHQVLYVKLPQTGNVMLSGDLYHYPEERTLQRVPTAEFDPEQTRQSRLAIERFLKDTGTQLWIQHDFVGNSKLKKAPQYYE